MYQKRGIGEYPFKAETALSAKRGHVYFGKMSKNAEIQRYG